MKGVATSELLGAEHAEKTRSGSGSLEETLIGV